MSTFKILNNCLVRVVFNGVSLFNAGEFKEVIVFPIHKISHIKKVNKLIAIELDSGSVCNLQHTTLEEANSQFEILKGALSGPTSVPVRDGPAPDVWAMEELK